MIHFVLELIDEEGPVFGLPLLDLGGRFVDNLFLLNGQGRLNNRLIRLIILLNLEILLTNDRFPWLFVRGAAGFPYLCHLRGRNYLLVNLEVRKVAAISGSGFFLYFVGQDVPVNRLFTLDFAAQKLSTKIIA